MEQGLFEKPVFVGRDETLRNLKNKLNLVFESKGNTIFIEGEAGIGKTRLVDEFIEQARNVKVIRASCLPGQLEPLFPIKVAFRETGLEHLVAGGYPTFLISIYLINRNGLLIAKRERKKTSLDADIFSSMLKAVSDFVEDSLSMMNISVSGNLNILGVGNYKIIIERNAYLFLAAIVRGDINEMLIEDMRNFLTEIGDRFKDWDGCVEKSAEIQSKIDWFISSGKYDGKYLVDDPRIKQQNMFDNILLGLKRISKKEPIVFFIDDLQWADLTTLLLLHYLSRNLREDRVLILGTYRTEDIAVEGVHPLRKLIENMKREGILEKIKLGRMSIENTEKIIKSLLPNLEFDEKFLKSIYRETEGVPFFILELIKYFVEKGYIVESDGKYVPIKMEEIHIPSSIHDIVVRRLEMLKNEDREILECASVIGEIFSSNILAKVVGISRVYLLKRLNYIEKTHMLIHFSGEKYRFDHAMIREILYNEINKELRMEYHRIIADVLIEEYGQNVKEIGEVAYHYYMAGDSRAVKYLIMAGDKAREMYANEEAGRFYHLALSMAEEDKYAELYEKIGDVHLNMGKFEEALRYYDSAISRINNSTHKVKLHSKKVICYERLSMYDKALDEIHAGIKLAENSRKEYIKLQMHKAFLYIRVGEYRKGITIAEKFVDELEEMEEKGEVVAECFSLLGSCYGTLGDYENSLNYFEKSMEICKNTKNIRGLARVYYDIGLIHHNKGDLNTAQDFYVKSLEIYKNIGDPWGLLKIYNNVATLYHDMGNYEEALKYHNESLKISKRLGAVYEMGVSYHNIGFSLYYLGKLRDALKYYEKSLEICESLGDAGGLAVAYSDMGDIYRDFGMYDKSLEYYRKSMGIYENIGDKWGFAYIYYLMGKLFVDTENYERAMEYFLKSMDVAESMNMVEPYVLSLLGIANICLSQKNFKCAEEKIKKCFKIAKSVGMKDLVARVERLYGRYYFFAGNIEEAERMYKASLEKFKEMKEEKEIAITLYYLAEIYLKIGDKLGKSMLERSAKYFAENGMDMWKNKCLYLLNHTLENSKI